MDLPDIWRHFVGMMVILENDAPRGPYTDIRNALLMQDAKRFCRTLKISWPAAVARLDTYVLDPNESVN